MKDIVFIEQLTVFAQIGVYDWEQEIRQKLMFDLEMAWDIHRAAQTDDVAFCLDYAKVSQFICCYVESRSFRLLEKLANDLAEQLQQHFCISWLKMKISKPQAVARAENVGVIITRGNT